MPFYPSGGAAFAGSFVWGSGSFNNQTYYNFLQVMEDGSMVPGSVPATSRVHLIEEPSLKDTGFYTIKMRVVEPRQAE